MPGMAVRGSIIPRPGAQRMLLLAGLVLGVVGWTGLAALAAALLAVDPPRAGFDLALVLEAGRRVAAGRSPYEPVLLAGSTPSAVDLFFAYPPVVAQAAALAAAVPLGAALLGLWVAAVAGLGWGFWRLAAAARFGDASSTAGLFLALMPFVAPFAVALLFGNLDALFPAVFGALLVWAVARSRSAAFAAGVAVGLATLAKLSPGTAILWLAVRATRRRDRLHGSGPGAVLAAALATMVLVVVVSLIAGGIGPWQEYLAVSQVVSGAALLDPRNIGPAAQVALWLGAGETAARAIHVAVVVLAVGGTLIAARAVDDPAASLFIAALASLVVLPLTWFHYPAVLVSFAVWRLMAPVGDGVRAWGWAPAALVVALVAVAWPVLLWLAVASVAVGVSGPWRIRFA